MIKFIICFCIIVVIGYVVTSPNFSSTKIVVYERYCKGYPIKKVESCSSDESNYSEKTYKVSFDTQVVVERVGSLPPEGLKNCSVYDKDNWSCGGKTMMDGQYIHFYSDTNEYSSVYFEQISRLRYTLWRVGNFF